LDAAYLSLAAASFVLQHLAKESRPRLSSEAFAERRKHAKKEVRRPLAK
jgi:hypothetical protein